MKKLLVMLSALLSLTAMSCTKEAQDASSTSTTKVSTTVAESDGDNVITESGPIELTVGGRATIELDANPTTGYQWELATEPDTTIVAVASDEYTATPAANGMVGSGGTQRVVVQGVAVGTTTIELRYVRPWESDQPAAQTASFTITVA